MDNQTTIPTVSGNLGNSSSSNTQAAASTVPSHHYHSSLNSSTMITHQRRELGDLQTLLVAEFTNKNSSNTSSSSLHSNEELQEAAMLFQDEKLLPQQTQQQQQQSSFYPTITVSLIIIMFVLYIHQYKTRQSKKQVLASYRLLVEKRAIYKAFLAILSHPPRTVRRRQRRPSRRMSCFNNHSRERRRGRRPYHHYLYNNNNNGLVVEGQQQNNVHGNNLALRWHGFVYFVKNRCAECLVQTWKAVCNGHLSGLPLLFYNAHILWSCRDLEKVVSHHQQHLSCYHHHHCDTIIHTHNDNKNDDDHESDHNVHNNNHPLQYLRLLVALACLTFGMELVITHLLLQSSFLVAETPSSSTDGSSDTAAAASSSSASSSSSLTITATNLTVVNASGGTNDDSSSYHHYVGIPGPPLSARPEYQTRQQRESAQERKMFWRQSLLYKPMGTMTAITTALLWIHRAHYHHVNVLQLQHQAQQLLQQQQQDEHDEDKDDNDAPPPYTINGENAYPSFNVLPLLVNPSFSNGPTSATISLISYSLALILLLLFSRFSHPGWAVLCGCIVGMLWGDILHNDHGTNVVDDDNNNKKHNENTPTTMVGGDDVAEGLLHFIAQPYYGDWLMFLLIFFSLLSLKRTRKWSGWLPFIDYVAWGNSSSSSSNNSSSCSNSSSTMTNTTATNNSGSSQQDQQQHLQQRQANLRRFTGAMGTTATRFMIGRSNEQEAFGFMDDDDHSHGNNDSDEDTDSEATSQNENDYDDFLVDNSTAERQVQSFASNNNAPSDEIDNSDGGEIYGRLPALGDFLDDEDEVDGDMELALRMSLQHL